MGHASLLLFSKTLQGVWPVHGRGDGGTREKVVSMCV